MQFNYKVSYFLIKNGKSGPTVYKYFVTSAEVKRFLLTKQPYIADYLVQDLNSKEIVTTQFKL